MVGLTQILAKMTGLKQVLLQTVKTQMKCSIIIRAYTVFKGQKDLQTKEYIFFNYNPTPLDLYNGLSQALLYQTRRKNYLVYKG